MFISYLVIVIRKVLLFIFDGDLIERTGETIQEGSRIVHVLML